MSGIDSVNVNSNRIGFIDQCKGIGIILMVYGHCTTEEYLHNNSFSMLFKSWFTSFHMPLFFIIGGILLAYKNESFIFPKTLVKKAKQLLLPGLCFSCLSIMMFILIKLISNENVLQYLKDSALGLLTLQFSDAMWFLPCYFFAEILFLLSIKRPAFSWWPFVVCLICFVIAIVTSFYSGYLIRISRTMIAICLIGFGYMLYQFALYKRHNNGDQKKTDSSRTRILLFGGGIILLVVGAVGSYFNGSVDCVSANYGKSPLLFLLDALAGSIGLILVFIAIDKRITPLEFFGKNSLIVLCTHLFFINIFWIVNSHVFHIELGKVYAPLFELVVLLIEIPIIYFINSYFPYIIGKKRK